MVKLSKKAMLLILLGLIVVGSFVTFYAGNLLCSDISNMFTGLHDIYIISSLPMCLVILYFVLAIIFCLRYYRYPEFKKNLFKLYSVLIAIVAIVGVVTSILTGTIVYHNMFAPYPFWGYTIVMLVIHVAMLAVAVLAFIYVRKMENDFDKKTIKFKYVLSTIILVVLIIMAMYRFGSVLWSPIYIQGRTLYLTIWFYIWVSVPLLILLHIILYFLNIYKTYSQALIFNTFIFALHLILGFVVYILMKQNPVFISAISPALPLERLATSPVDTYIELFGIGALSLYYLIYSARSYFRESR